jgi:hypothetical protein
LVKWEKITVLEELVEGSFADQDTVPRPISERSSEHVQNGPFSLLGRVEPFEEPT